jgi:hypothetical protein
MNRQKLGFFLIVVSSIFLPMAHATSDSTSNALAPTGIKPNASPMYNVANVFYVTFQMACPDYQPSNPQACSTSTNPFFYKCPQGLILVPGSGTYVPPIPGAPAYLNLSTANYYWQCMQGLNGFSIPPQDYVPAPGTGGNPQPFVNMTYADSTYAGTVQGVSSPQYGVGGVYNIGSGNLAPNWILDNVDDQSGNTNFTYFQFPGNSFIPTGIGGSGIGCNTNQGDVLTISCTDSFGRNVNTIPASNGVTPTSPIIFYIPPGTSATCQVTRTYGPNPSTTCNATVTIPSGQTKVMACCSGSFACGTSTWSDTALTTCLACPSSVVCN